MILFGEGTACPRPAGGGAGGGGVLFYPGPVRGERGKGSMHPDQVTFAQLDLV